MLCYDRSASRTGEWPSGKAPDSGSGDRRFESFLPSHSPSSVDLRSGPPLGLIEGDVRSPTSQEAAACSLTEIGAGADAGASSDRHGICAGAHGSGLRDAIHPYADADVRVPDEPGRTGRPCACARDWAGPRRGDGNRAPVRRHGGRSVPWLRHFNHVCHRWPRRQRSGHVRDHSGSPAGRIARNRPPGLRQTWPRAAGDQVCRALPAVDLGRAIAASSPVITSAVVKGLAQPDFLVEMDAIAIVPA